LKVYEGGQVNKGMKQGRFTPPAACTLGIPARRLLKNAETRVSKVMKLGYRARV
jgi:hypothetical protein